MDWRWCEFRELELTEIYALLRLRQEVFVVEQDCPYLDADGLDDRAWHLLGTQDGVLVAYLRAFAPGVVYEDGVIGRVVTHQSVRGQGLGRPLMREGMNRLCRQFGPCSIRVSAQAHLEPYYRSLGYEVIGPGYDEDGIPHLPMRWNGAH
jgi:ElaA protein